jgi:hypothetical protein
VNVDWKKTEKEQQSNKYTHMHVSIKEGSEEDGKIISNRTEKKRKENVPRNVFDKYHSNSNIDS